jgi:hypothetical protein
MEFKLKLKIKQSYKSGGGGAFSCNFFNSAPAHHIELSVSFTYICL